MGTTDPDAEPESIPFFLARLLAAFQLLAAGLLAALCVVTLLTVEKGNPLHDVFGAPELAASVAAAIVSIGFERRRCWARAFLLGECLLLPAAAVFACVSLRRTEMLDTVLLAPLVVIGMGCLVGILSLKSPAVRNWCR